MVGIRLKNHVLEVTFKHPRFAALLPTKRDITVKDLSNDIWQYPKSILSSASFENFSPPGSQLTYDGSISFWNVGFEYPEYNYEATRRVDVIDAGSVHVSLPTARIKAEVNFENLDPRVTKTLQWYGDVIDEPGLSPIHSQIVATLSEILEALVNDSDQATDILSEYEQKEKKFRFLARKIQEDPTKLSFDVLQVEKSLDPFRSGQALLAALLQAIELDADSLKGEISDILSQTLTNLQSMELLPKEENEEAQAHLRLRKGFMIQSALKEVKDGQRELPEGVNPKLAVQLAQDFFHIVMTHWNNFVRYLKYEESQHWINEYPVYAAGLFYVINKTTLDGKEILPQMSAHVRQEVLRHHLVDKSKWEEILSFTVNGDRLKEYEMDWTVAGVLSQAVSHLTRNELSAAVILSGVALEEAATRALFHVDPKEYDEKGLAHKSHKIHQMIGRESLMYESGDWDSDWRLLNSGNKETGKGLIQIRRRLQHPEVGLKKAMPTRVEIAERVLATQRMCRALLRWERSQRTTKL